MTEIRLPKLNANDDAYLLTEWMVADGQPVRVGDAVAVVETSKAAEEIVSEAGGILVHLVQAGTECAPGTVIGRLRPAGSQVEPPRAAGRHEPPDAAAVADVPVVTAPARALLDELGIPASRLQKLGRRIIRRADVEQLAVAVAEPATSPPAAATPRADAPGEARAHVLSRTQQTVAATVEQSHRTVPAAYVVLRVEAGPALAFARRLTKQLRTLIGLPELVVAAVASLHERFPLFFATPLDERTMRLPDAAHVGVTIDVGKGLYVPVVRDAARQSLAEVAKTLMGFRLTALRGRFTEENLTGANIMVALNSDSDVVLAVPIVFPGHTCAVAVAGTHDEPAVGESGQITVRTVVNIGVAHDHRVINGRDAVLFLQALKALIESPEETWPEKT